MLLPIEYRYHPDTEEGRNLKGQGYRVMVILESMMALGTMQERKIQFCPYDGSLIVARKFFGQRIVDIHTQLPKPVNPKEKNPICLCNCNFSIGWILEVQEDTISGAPLYTVMACNSKGTVFAPYKDILASDWTLYDVGQRVAMVPYYTMSYLCCSDKSGGGGPRGCKPVVSEDEKTDESWRTTYRIIPLCTLKIPLKVEKERWNPNG